MVGQDERLDEVEVEVGGNFLGVETAAVRVSGGVADDGQFFQFDELDFYEVADLAEVDAFELVLVELRG